MSLNTWGDYSSVECCQCCFIVWTEQTMCEESIWFHCLLLSNTWLGIIEKDERKHSGDDSSVGTHYSLIDCHDNLIWHVCQPIRVLYWITWLLLQLLLLLPRDGGINKYCMFSKCCCCYCTHGGGGGGGATISWGRWQRRSSIAMTPPCAPPCVPPPPCAPRPPPPPCVPHHHVYHSSSSSNSISSNNSNSSSI